MSGSPDEYASYFSIDQRTGVVRQVRPVDREQVERFVMEVRAREKTEAGREAVARLEIRVEAKDIHPPELRVSGQEGEVMENSAPGTLVLDTQGQPITFTVTDQDLSLVPESERPVYDFEFTSGMFELNSDRQLVVKTDNLDRDSPNQPVLTLQVRNIKCPVIICTRIFKWSREQSVRRDPQS